MSNPNNANEMLAVIGQVLIRCFVMRLLVLLFWLAALALGGDLAYSTHTRIVPISREQFYLIHYTEGLMAKAGYSFCSFFHT